MNKITLHNFALVLAASRKLSKASDKLAEAITEAMATEGSLNLPNDELQSLKRAVAHLKEVCDKAEMEIPRK